MEWNYYDDDDDDDAERQGGTHKHFVDVCLREKPPLCVRERSSESSFEHQKQIQEKSSAACLDDISAHFGAMTKSNPTITLT